uniref:Uncharacterized protein n=1 Tax=Anguilla anguilla TaxID=7936 RepID=A0A0E9U2T1_ANGAN
MGSPRMWSGEGRANRNFLVSWLTISLSIRRKAYFILGS